MFTGRRRRAGLHSAARARHRTVRIEARFVDADISVDLRDKTLAARAFLDGKIGRTPLEYSAGLSERLGVPVHLKLECLQITGSFKIRGAWFRLSRLTAEQRASGILTCSAGNHGKAVAYGARELGVQAVICVPSSVDRAKYD